MTSSQRETLVRQIHDAGTAIVLAVTGGGASAIAQLLRVPGGSRSVLEAVVPYSAAALANYLRHTPENACSEPTARAMAMSAWQRARRWDDDERPIGGVACTASLASDRPKRGPHRAHLAWQAAERTVSWSVELNKGARSRADEEDVVADLLLAAIAESLGLTARPAELMSGERVERREFVASPDWRRLLLGEIDHVAARSTNRPSPPVAARAIFPGSFNPRHAGHKQMAQIGAEILGCRVDHEISIENVEKPALDYLEMEKRASQFDADEILWFTRAPHFTTKAAIFPGATFLVGADTIARLADLRFHNQNPAERSAAIQSIADCGCRFLVFGRQTEHGFMSVSNLELPAELKPLCQEVPADHFRVDISSTELRRQDTG